jgi:ankyrin repeat protein
MLLPGEISMEGITSFTGPITTTTTPTGAALPGAKIAHAIANVTNSAEEPPFIDDPLTLEMFYSLDKILDYDLTLNDRVNLFDALPPDLAQNVIRHYALRNQNGEQLQKTWNDKVIGSNLKTTRFFIACGKRIENNNINVNALNKDGYSALNVASRKGMTDVVQALLRTTDIDVDIRERDSGDTALISAAQSGHTTIIWLLLKQNANVIMTNFSNYNASTFAEKNGNHYITTLLRTYPCMQTYQKIYGDTILISAARCNNAEIVKRQLENGADINLTNRNNETALMVAAQAGYHNIVALLLTTPNIALDTQHCSRHPTKEFR